MRQLILLVIVLGASTFGAVMAAPVNVAAELANLGHPAASAVATAESDTIFANGYDNDGSQCLTIADCPDTGSQCTTSTCESGTCGVGNVGSYTTCSSGGYCGGGSCVCDGMGNCTPTCSGVGTVCIAQPDQCHSPGICSGEYCNVPHVVPDGSPCGTGSGIGHCVNGACEP